MNSAEPSKERGVMTTPWSYIVVVLLAALVMVSIGIFFGLRRLTAEKVTEGLFNPAIERLQGSLEHYAEVNAVLALAQQFTTRPEAIEKLVNYSHDVVAAVLLARVNSLGNRLQVVQEQLERGNALFAKSPHQSHYKQMIKLLQMEEQDLLAELAVADRAVQAFGGGPIIA